MSLKICSLFSGSTGNCTYIAGDGTEILVDAGVPAAKIEKALKVLGADTENVSVLLTHRHSDHISGLKTLVKKHSRITVYAREETAAYLDGISADRIKLFDTEDFYVGALTVSPIPLSHDVDCVGFGFRCGGRSITYMTDTGVLPSYAIDTAKHSDIALIECNHSPDLLAANPNYSYVLKRRISSLRGHLSNEDCATAVTELARAGVKHFILAHLSRENNYPELAESVVRDALDAAGLGGVAITVAYPDKLSGLMEIV